MSGAPPGGNPFVSVVVPARNPGGALQRLVDAMVLQQVDFPVEVVVVDDASSPPVALPALADSPVRLRMVRHDRRRGRAIARNTGATASRGDLLLFLDVDCIPSSPTFLAAHARVLSTGVVASCGNVLADGSGFWDRYQNEAAARRETLFRSGLPCAGSAANLMVRRAVFDRIQGFDPRFTSYGFEDRDLLSRLAEVGGVGWAGEANAVHHADIRLAEVAAKLMQAGTDTAPLFSARHPDAYRALGYAAIDARIRPWLWPFGRVLGPAARALAGPLDGLLGQRWMPYPLAKPLAKTIGALSFLHGTTHARAQ